MKVESAPDSYIGSVASGPQRAAAAPAAGAEVAAVAGSSAKVQAGVTVTLSPTSQAMAAGGGADVFNAAKVESMKLAIANGTFQINAEAIADRMLSNAAEMLSATRV